MAGILDIKSLFRTLITFSGWLIILALCSSCKKENLNNCFTNAGAVTTEDRTASYFSVIDLADNVNLVLEEGDHFAVRAEAGSNLLPLLQTEISDSTLIIRNNMKCNWIRNYGHELTVYVSSPALHTVNYEGSGDITTKDTFQCDSLEINVWGGAGSFTLDMLCKKLNLQLHYGTVDFNVSGFSKTTSIYANSYGPFNCGALNSDIVFLRNSGTNDCYVHANHVLSVEITSVGNVYYSGNPWNLESHITGTGKLIKIPE